MELVPKDIDISEMEIKELNSYCHIWAVSGGGYVWQRMKEGQVQEGSAWDSKEWINGIHSFFH